MKRGKTVRTSIFQFFSSSILFTENPSYGSITCIRFMGIFSARHSEHPFS